MTQKHLSAREINEMIDYTCWAVFNRTSGMPEDNTALVEETLAKHPDLKIRGWYDVSGSQPNAQLMIWAHGPSFDGVQDALRDIKIALNGGLGNHEVEMTWSAFGMHRPAEFNKGNVPAFLAGKPEGEWVCVYPFVRSYDWYVIDPSERREMLLEHGNIGRANPQIRSSTLAAFGFGDYEWVVSLEADHPWQIVDLMRQMRDSEARLHVRNEYPFHFGHRVKVSGIVNVLI
ncbi:hydrogen peroxide-dependent heme synthase [Propionimicrobium lymphophilum]|uniref:hydrogen peroxide-dependent heme synthase n=1 Tax=Propionimicrobium lymphophilum TaxID=33012 RepID=UPI0023F45388|nr:hydrogen peroxide-dependent heme synthase [Propionimicrobium lymphophilum]